MSEVGALWASLSHDPETAHAIGLAFDEARKALGLSNKIDGVTRLLADRIIDAAAAGERDPARLRDAAISYFRNGT